jgi:hypothetical protein
LYDWTGKEHLWRTDSTTFDPVARNPVEEAVFMNQRRNNSGPKAFNKFRYIPPEPTEVNPRSNILLDVSDVILSTSTDMSQLDASDNTHSASTGGLTNEEIDQILEIEAEEEAELNERSAREILDELEQYQRDQEGMSDEEFSVPIFNREINQAISVPIVIQDLGVSDNIQSAPEALNPYAELDGRPAENTHNAELNETSAGTKEIKTELAGLPADSE